MIQFKIFKQNKKKSFVINLNYILPKRKYNKLMLVLNLLNSSLKNIYYLYLVYYINYEL